VHDLSDGGLAVALAEMAMAGKIGAELTAAPADVAAHAFWFGEDQARYVVTAKAADAEAIVQRARAASVPAMRLGTTGGHAVAIVGERAVPIAALHEAHEKWLPAYMAGSAA